MTSEPTAWLQLQTLAQQARQAGNTRRRLEVTLSPEVSAALAEVLEATLRLTSAMLRPGLDLSEPTAGELAYLAMYGGAFGWLANEPDLYGDANLKERFVWPIA